MASLVGEPAAMFHHVEQMFPGHTILQEGRSMLTGNSGKPLYPEVTELINSNADYILPTVLFNHAPLLVEGIHNNLVAHILEQIRNIANLH